jgi:hypothetical protein
MLVSFQYVLNTAIIQRTRLLPVALLYREYMTFLTVNAHNRMLDVIGHRNLETTYMKHIEEGARFRRLMLKFRFIFLSEFRYPN